MRAQISFDLWEGIREARAKQDAVSVMKRYPGIFPSLEHALFDSFIVILYSLYEKRRDTVTIDKLLGYLESSLNTDKRDIFFRQAEENKKIWVKIGILRNNVVGHQSLNGKPEDYFTKADISEKEIREFIVKSQCLLRSISLEAFDKGLPFNTKSKAHLKTLFEDLSSRKSS